LGRNSWQFIGDDGLIGLFLRGSVSVSDASVLSLHSLVAHPVFGTGKVVSLNAAEVRVYFPTPTEPNPDKRVRLFRLPTQFLSPLPPHTHSDLIDLPPWTETGFQRFKTSLTLLDAEEIFRSHFPDGLSDARYLAQEVHYKRAAHDRYCQSQQEFAHSVGQRDADRVRQLVSYVYKGASERTASTDPALNFLYQRIDEPVFFDALSLDDGAALGYAQAAIGFARTSTREGFNSLAESLGRLAQLKGNRSLESWTTATWLPFVAAPESHILVKPTLLQAFASMLPFELQYRAELNFGTYERCVAMAMRLKAWLHGSELNAQKRSLDLIDVQSFMWVVERYHAGD
jgi:hypothetical protein